MVKERNATSPPAANKRRRTARRHKHIAEIMSRAETSGAIKEVLLQPAPAPAEKHKLEHGFRCSPFAVHSLVQGLSPQHKSFVHEMGFGSLLALPRVWLPRALVTQLLSMVDCKQGTLAIGPVTLTIRPLVWKIVGLPAGPTKVPFSDVDQSVEERFHAMTLANLKMGLRNIQDKKHFQQSFLLFAVKSSLLCPTTQASINRRFYASASSIDSVKNMDWCECIYGNLMEGIKDYQQLPPESRDDKIHVKGCVYILAVIFLDFLDGVQSKPAGGFPRMAKISDEQFKPYKKIVDWSQLQFLPLEDTVYASASHEETDADADAAAASALMMLANVVDSTSSQDDKQAEGILEADDSAGDDDAP